MLRRNLRSFFVPNVWSLLAIALFFTSTIAARTNAPQLNRPNATTTTISYQGTLASSGGQAVNAALPMTFKLYLVPSGGSPVWTEARSGANAVPVNNGLFNVLLGSVTPIDLSLLSQDLWLGISVNGDAEMTPREKLGTVPFAAMAGTVPDGSITSDKLHPTVGATNNSQEITLTLPQQPWERMPIPSMKLSFTVSRPSTIMIWFSGMYAAQNNSVGDRDILAVLDGKVVGHAPVRQEVIGGGSAAVLVNVEPGNHDLEMWIQGNQSATLFIGGGWAKLMYQVVSQ